MARHRSAARSRSGCSLPTGVGSSNFVANWSDNHADVVRLDSNWTIDDPVRMRSLRFGDSISRSGVGGLALRFGGIQLARNFAVQPDFVTIPLPSLRGSAAVPSVVDIYVNEALRGSREVPAGPVDLTGLPIVSGNGDVQLVVRDLLGRQTLYNQPYFWPRECLHRGFTTILSRRVSCAARLRSGATIMAR